ncbi:MAG: dissimilatory-type sulfite reductase subunit beta, partial [Chromatiales bacterium]
MAEMRDPIETGCPDPFQYMHPMMRRNFGMWAYHEHPRTGVLLHVAKNGDKIWTIKAGTQRILDLFTLRKLCDIADNYSDGFIRFTIRSNPEFFVTEESRVEPLIAKLEEEG